MKKILFWGGFLLLLFFSFDSFARLGGGGRYSGGSSGGSSGGGYSSGGSGNGGMEIQIVYWIIRLAVQYPIVGVPLGLGIAFVYFKINFYQNKQMSRTIQRSYSDTFTSFNDTKIPYVNYSELKKRDLEFNETDFIERIKQAFMNLQNAWNLENMTSVRPLLSDGLFEAFNIQIRLLQTTQLANKFTKLSISNLEVVKVETDSFYDVIHVEITAQSADWYEDREKGKILLGDKNTVTSFKEYWSFLRRPGAKTLKKAGLAEGYCPNCGAFIEMTDKTTCEYCQAVVNSGEYDWVLAEISQEHDWQNTPAKQQVLGFKEMKAKDPGFNLQYLEDRTNAIFWRLRGAETFSEKSLISKYCSPNFINEYQKNYQKNPDGTTAFFADTAIGNVALIDVKVNQGNKDEARFRVKWSGHKEEKTLPSLIKPNLAKSNFYIQEFIFVRDSDVQSSEKSNLASLNCSSCGAPESLKTDNKCEYCGTILNDGSTDWVLDRIGPFSGIVNHLSASSSEESQEMSLPKFDYEEMLIAMVIMMYEDKKLDPEEMSLLQTFAKKWNIGEKRLQNIVNTAVHGNYSLPNISNKIERRQFMLNLVRMCLIDGEVSDSELKRLCEFGENWEFTKIDINYMIRDERKNMYQAAKKKKNKQLGIH